MSQRLNQFITQKLARNEKLLSVFITAGFPEFDATAEIIITLADCGVDFIELGIPFSDPIADGPVIQEASDRAIHNGMNLAGALDTVSNVRLKSNIPILLMGYLNPIYHFGIEPFIRQAKAAGADGLIIPDWPLEENRDYHPLLTVNDLDLIHLIAPNTPDDRLRLIDEASTSFIYCVAYTGVTGQATSLSSKDLAFFKSLKSKITHPLLIGFGVKNRQDFLTYTQFVDGVIIGSAFIKMLAAAEKERRKDSIIQFVRSIKP